MLAQLPPFSVTHTPNICARFSICIFVLIFLFSFSLVFFFFLSFSPRRWFEKCNTTHVRTAQPHANHPSIALWAAHTVRVARLRVLLIVLSASGYERPMSQSIHSNDAMSHTSRMRAWLSLSHLCIKASETFSFSTESVCELSF